MSDPCFNGEELALSAQLRYVVDAEPGIKRIRRGSGFSYAPEVGDGRITEFDRKRIEALAIPPAWRHVWICSDPHGHLQVTGRDQADRKQYLYHKEWERVRDQAKFDRMSSFGRSLPHLRQQVEGDLRLRGMVRPRIVALTVAVLDQTLIRVGNDRYAVQNGSFGLTTLTADHVDIEQGVVRLNFVGKGGAEQEVALRNRGLASLVAQCEELNGQRLFSYRAGKDRMAAVTSDDINDYLRRVMGSEFTAKDFRTWGASTVAVEALGPLPSPSVDPDTDFLAAVDLAAEALGNTRAVCRQSYVHPHLAEAFAAGDLAEAWRTSRRSRWAARGERALLRVLEHD